MEAWSSCLCGYLLHLSALAAGMCCSSKFLWGRGVLVMLFTVGMVGQKAQWLLVHKICQWWKSISPSFLSSHTIIILLCVPAGAFHATINQIPKWRHSCVKNEIYSSFVEGKTAETDLELACPALCPGVVPLLTELLLVGAALDLLSTENPLLNPVWDSNVICAKMTLVKQGSCSCRSQTSNSK